MTWLRLDDGFDENLKLLLAGPKAGWLNVRGMLFCARNETDGFIPKEALAKIGSDYSAQQRTKLVRSLIEAGLWHLAKEAPKCKRCKHRWKKTPGDGWVIHDFLDFNPSKEKLEADRAAARSRMAKVRSTDVRANGNGTPAEVRSTRPVPSRPGVGDESKSLNRGVGIDDLADRMSRACKKSDANEAMNVVEMLAKHIDLTLIDECIGYTMKLDSSKQPRSPRYFLRAVTDWARKRGVQVPEITLEEVG